MTEMRGRCLCGTYRFELVGAVAGVGQCHCSQCRKVTGSNGCSMVIVPKEQFRWTAEGAEPPRFSLPSGWSALRCETCGSPLPDSHDEKRVWVPAGLMEDDLGTDIKVHIFCGSRADWDRESEEALHHDEWPE